MQLLFNITANGTTIGDTNFQDHYPRINKNAAWKPFKTELRKVTRDLVVPYVTKEFYNDLATKFHSDATLTEQEQEVLTLLQDAIAEYTIWKLSPMMNVTIGDMGIQENHGKDGTSPAAAMWRYKHFHWNVMLAADCHLDMALNYLDENATAIPIFDAHRANLKLDKFIVRSTADFEQFVPLNGSRRTFRKLIPSMLKANLQYVYPILGKAFYHEILAQHRAGTLTEPNKEVLQRAQEVVCHFALFHALPTLSVMIEAEGIFALTSTDGMNTKQRAHENRIQDLKDRNKKDANQAKENLVNWLYSNEENYPTWKASEAYTHFDDSTGYPVHWGAGAVFLG